MKLSLFTILLIGFLGRSTLSIAQGAAVLFAQAQKEHDPRKAIVLYTRTLALDPQNARAYEKRALLKEKLGQTIRATADLDTLIQLEPAMATGYYLRARCYTALERTRQALADYDQVIDLDEAVVYPDAHLLRALTYISLEQHDKGLPDLNWYIVRYPQQGEGHYLRGLVNIRKGHYASAIQDFNRVIRLNNDRVSDAYGQRANAHYALGDLHEATQDTELALSLNPQNEFALRLKTQLGTVEAESKP